jgi:hypothetical protein
MGILTLGTHALNCAALILSLSYWADDRWGFYQLVCLGTFSAELLLGMLLPLPLKLLLSLASYECALEKRVLCRPDDWGIYVPDACGCHGRSNPSFSHAI